VLTGGQVSQQDVHVLAFRLVGEVDSLDAPAKATHRLNFGNDQLQSGTVIVSEQHPCGMLWCNCISENTRACAKGLCNYICTQVLLTMAQFDFKQRTATAGSYNFNRCCQKRLNSSAFGFERSPSDGSCVHW
jgi:hypothetical protein